MTSFASKKYFLDAITKTTFINKKKPTKKSTLAYTISNNTDGSKERAFHFYAAY